MPLERNKEKEGRIQQFEYMVAIHCRLVVSNEIKQPTVVHTLNR